MYSVVCETVSQCLGPLTRNGVTWVMTVELVPTLAYPIILSHNWVGFAELLRGSNLRAFPTQEGLKWDLLEEDNE